MTNQLEHQSQARALVVGLLVGGVSLGVGYLWIPDEAFSSGDELGLIYLFCVVLCGVVSGVLAFSWLRTRGR